MKSIEQYLLEFKKLTAEQKYNKVLAMLEILKENDDFFKDLYELVSGLGEDVDEELLLNIYEIIQTAILDIEKNDLDKDKKKSLKLKNKLQKLKKLEEKQKQEEDPDKLLEQLL